MKPIVYLRHSRALMVDIKNYQDDQLIGLIKSGDVTAYTEIYRRYASTLYVVARNATGDPAKAEDIVQDVFVALWQRRLQNDNIVLKGWLLLATRFQVLKSFRQHKSNRVLQKRFEIFCNNLQQGDTLHYRELQRRIPAVIRSLPHDQQTIFKLHREEDLSYREIATRLGVSIKTVEKKMSQALRHLRLEIGENIAIVGWFTLHVFYFIP